MVTSIRPSRGGFLGPFGCGWFIREFLLGHGPEGAPAIDSYRGAPQEDIFYHYKLALRRAYAEDAVAWENEERVRQGKPIYSPEEYAERFGTLLKRIPYKLTKCRYHSCQRYFHLLKQLAWVEFIGEEEVSSLQANYPDAPPRRYYRLTKTGIQAPNWQWSNPQLTLCPKRPLGYFREKRRERQYSPRHPAKRRPRA